MTTFRMEVDAFRGDRNHLLASDVLAVAPLFPDLQSFEFYFRQPARHPGSWRPTASGPPKDPFRNVATLRLSSPTQVEDWAFVVDTSLAITRRLNDLDEDKMCNTLAIDGRKSRLVMTGSYALSEYITACARRFFAPAQWYFSYLKGNYEPFSSATDGRELQMSVVTIKGRFVEFEFAVDRKRAGLFAAFRRS
jgi:hypothetical protein